jgi:hypothetical protein
METENAWFTVPDWVPGFVTCSAGHEQEADSGTVALTEEGEETARVSLPDDALVLTGSVTESETVTLPPFPTATDADLPEALHE